MFLEGYMEFAISGLLNIENVRFDLLIFLALMGYKK